MAESETSRGLRLLSLDGGGIRGLSELLIIEEIMKRIQNQSKLQHVPRPAEYFDLIGGTSTGGLIAILLGRLGLSAGEAIEVYRRLAGRIFSERKWKFQDGTFKSTILEEEMKTIVKEKLGPDQADAKMLEDEGQGQGCKMFVCATPALNVAFPRRFRNYRVRRHEAYNCTIWEAGRATSAAPTFFKRIEIDGEQFVDAGIGCNNPIKEVISEAQLAFGKERKVDCIISIGTGKAGVVGFDKPTGFQRILPLDLIKVLRKMATDSSSTAEEMEQRYEGSAQCYFRFDVDQGLQDVGLDEWVQLGAVKTHTITYTMETNVNRRIDAVIGLLTGPDSPKAYSLAQLGGQISSTKGGSISAKDRPWKKRNSDGLLRDLGIGGQISSTKVGSMSAKDRHLKPAINVPFRDLDFVDRADIMTQISKSFLYPGARVALVGVGGIGKSQLAIEYTHRARDAFPQTCVFWVHASNQARMQQGFEQIAEVLDLPGREDFRANIFQIVGQWLGNTSDKWLLVVDNADDPIMFSRLAREEKAKEESAKENPWLLTFPPLVTPHLPHTQNGSILITSRNKEASLALVEEDQNIIRVGEMNEKESLDLLLKKLNKTVDPQGASDLVKALEYIPLAITQAAAFLSRQKGRVSISQYVKDFNKSNENIIHLLTPESVNPRGDHSAVNSIIATWQISFDHIRVNRPSASEILSLMSFFNYQGVPEFLLHDPEDLVQDGRMNKDLKRDFQKSIQILRDYSLISLGEDISTFRMHRLVQTSTQDWLKSHGKHDALWRSYLRIMSNALPLAVYEEWEKYRQLLPHVEFVSSREPTDEVSAQDWVRILGKVTRHNFFQGRYGEAEETSRKMLKRSERLFGGDHSITLEALHALAFILMQVGKYEAAEETTRRLVDRRRRLVGEKNPATLGDMAILATVLSSQGKFEDAETILRSVLEIAQREYPKDNFYRQQCREDLAVTLEEQGKYDEAETIYREVLKERKERSQQDDISTLIVMRNLAQSLMRQGAFQEAEEIHREALKKRERLLGPNDFLTIESRIDLASLLGKAGRRKEAEMIGRQALKEAERVFGQEHPLARKAMNDLEGMLRHQRERNKDEYE